MHKFKVYMSEIESQRPKRNINHVDYNPVEPKVKARKETDAEYGEKKSQMTTPDSTKKRPRQAKPKKKDMVLPIRTPIEIAQGEDDNKPVLDLLTHAANQEEGFKAKSYTKAAETIRLNAVKIESGRQAMALPHIGKSIGEKIDKLLKEQKD